MLRQMIFPSLGIKSVLRRDISTHLPFVIMQNIYLRYMDHLTGVEMSESA